MICHRSLRHKKLLATLVTVAVLFVLYIHVSHGVWPARQPPAGQQGPMWRPDGAGLDPNTAVNSGLTTGRKRGVPSNKGGSKGISRLANNDKDKRNARHSVDKTKKKGSNENVRHLLNDKNKGAMRNVYDKMKNHKNSNILNTDETDTRNAEGVRTRKSSDFQEHPSSQTFVRIAQQISVRGNPTDISVRKNPSGLSLQNPTNVSTTQNSTNVITWQPEDDEKGTVQSQEAHHLFFLKVHKAASTTVLNVIYRFALRRRLAVVLPVPNMANVLSENSKNWTHNAAPLPPGAQHFDILCNHLIFEENSIRKALPKDAFFVGIVRWPFDQFVSAFWYYREKYRYDYLLRIHSKQPISEYLKNPRRWEKLTNRLQFTHNRMSVDFGMDPLKAHDGNYVKSYINYLDSTFHLVMVSERFDESILLLRRLLGWRLQDVLYIKNNVKTKHHPYNQNFTERERQAHKEFNMADYQLYDHFSKLLDEKIRVAGPSFQEEVRSFRVVLKAVSDYCRGRGAHRRPLRVSASFWREEFVMTLGMCQLMTLDEMTFVALVREATAEMVGRG